MKYLEMEMSMSEPSEGERDGRVSGKILMNPDVLAAGFLCFYSRLLLA